MARKGLIIGIDYTNEYCQACFYSNRHDRPESIASGSEVMRYLIPTVLAYNPQAENWYIGDAAIKYSEESNCILYGELLEKAKSGRVGMVDEMGFSYQELLAVFFGKLIEQIQISTSVMRVENITINLRNIDIETKEVMLEAFRLLKINTARVKLQSCPESFAYYVLNEKQEIWKNGVLLLDYSEAGFFTNYLTVRNEQSIELTNIDEQDYTSEFSFRELNNDIFKSQQDNKLNALFEEFSQETGLSSVFFIGSGFNELWFKETLDNISEKGRAFKGNNIYAKGACLAGKRRADGKKDFDIICNGRTKATISAEVRYKGDNVLMNLSKAPIDWYDADFKAEFVLDDSKTVSFYVTSLITRQRTQVEFDLSEFPDRPNKTTRIEVEITYSNDHECVISVKDKGFGEFFESSNKVVAKHLDMEGFI